MILVVLVLLLVLSLVLSLVLLVLLVLVAMLVMLLVGELAMKLQVEIVQKEMMIVEVEETTELNEKDVIVRVGVEESEHVIVTMTDNVRFHRRHRHPPLLLLLPPPPPPPHRSHHRTGIGEAEKEKREMKREMKSCRQQHRPLRFLKTTATQQAVFGYRVPKHWLPSATYQERRNVPLDHE